MIESNGTKIEEHKYKIAHPEEFYSDWSTTDESEKARKISHWKSEIRTFENNIKKCREELKKRGEKDE